VFPHRRLAPQLAVPTAPARTASTPRRPRPLGFHTKASMFCDVSLGSQRLLCPSAAEYTLPTTIGKGDGATERVARLFRAGRRAPAMSHYRLIRSVQT
jgi:hypothetical protein